MLGFQYILQEKKLVPQSTSYSSHAADPRQIAAEVVEIAGLVQASSKQKVNPRVVGKKKPGFGGMSVQLQGIENIRHFNVLGLLESGWAVNL